MPATSFKQFQFNGLTDGGVETCVRVKPFQFLFDIGRCPELAIPVPNLFLTHGHLDHASGVPYYVSQRSLRKLPPPNIYVVPELFEPLKLILETWSQIEGFRSSYNLISAEPGREFEIGQKHYLAAARTFHRVPSIGWTLYERSQKLKSEYAQLPGRELGALREKGVVISDETGSPLVTFSGDTKIEFILEYEHVRKSKILFLECTYIDEARDVETTRFWGHIHLDEIIAHANEFENERIVLMHFSKRYSPQYIRSTLQKKLPASLAGRLEPFIE